jgi:hypothetical protein
LLLGFLFFFRLGFGLCSDFWSSDEMQVYLLGLKFFSTHSWPFFGPDVYPDLRPVVQIPGALQGLLVGLPFFVLPIPEAPYVLLNVLSFSALGLLAWYCTRRLPDLSPWAIWTWTLTAPWALEFSTHVLNPSYVLFGSILFFVGMMEACPPLGRNVLSAPAASFLMGFALTWIMQLHLSWVLLLPYLLAAACFQAARGARHVARFCLFSLLGASMPAILLVPTLATHGFSSGLGGTEHAFGLNPGNIRTFFTLLVRYLSFADFQLYYFFEEHGQGWLPLLRSSPWLIPVVAFPALVGLVQPVAMVMLWFARSHSERDWRAIKTLALLSLLLIYAAFLFSEKRPKAHTFYVTFPVIFTYSLYCWSTFAAWRRWNAFVWAFLVCGMLAQGSYALHVAPAISLYRDREIPRVAIAARDHLLLARRRAGARY